MPDDRVISGEALAFAPLDRLDGELALNVADLPWAAMPLRDVALTVTMKGGTLAVDIANASPAAGGNISGEARVDAISGEPQVSLDLRATQVALSAFGGGIAEALEGAIDAEVRLAGRGASLADIAASLDGRISMVVGEGRARAAAMDRFVGGASTLLSALRGGGDEWTVVNCAAVAFRVEDGVATSEVLVFDSAAATVAGHGTIDLGTETLDLVVSPEPKVVTLNVAVPVLIEGTFARPRFTPDPVAAARKLAGVLGLFVFPPAAIVGLGEHGSRDNLCLSLALDGSGGPAADGAGAGGEAGAGLGSGVEGVLEGVGQGLRSLFGD